MKRILFFIAMALVVVACDKEEEEGVDPAIQAAIDDQIIQDYIKTLPDSIQDVVQKDPSGLYYIITKQGSGGHPNLYSQVHVYYTGWLMETGEIFEDHSENVAIFNLSGLIQGWQIGIPMLEKKGKGTFYIPSGLAYGDKQSGSIPANSVLIFDIYLADFQNY